MLDKSKNYKIDVTELGTDERKILHEKLFSIGYKLCIDIYGNKISRLDADYILLNNAKNISYCFKKEVFNFYPGVILNSNDIISEQHFVQEPGVIFFPQGISLRDYFAGQALSGQLSRSECFGWDFEDFAKEAYKHADAMLKARSC